MMLDLQAQGCHNINLVSPTHFTPQIVKALVIAVERGLRLPIVYNTNAYDSVEVLGLLDGIVDIYLPDLKYSDDGAGRAYSKISGYVDHARAALREMYRQVGHELVYDDRHSLHRGLIVRLLILPNDQAGIRDSLRFIRDELSPKVALSVMAQFFPANQATVERNPLLSRRIRPAEYWSVLDMLEEFGLEEGWVQDFDSPDYYRPDFTNGEVPFRDIRDFQPPLPSAHTPGPLPPDFHPRCSGLRQKSDQSDPHPTGKAKGRLPLTSTGGASRLIAAAVIPRSPGLAKREDHRRVHCAPTFGAAPGPGSIPFRDEPCRFVPHL